MRRGGMGGGIFALRRPRPYSRHGRGFRCDASPPTIICDHVGINGNGEWEDNDAAHRVATVFEKWNCLIETDLRARRENPPQKLNPYGHFAAVSFWNTAA